MGNDNDIASIGHARELARKLLRDAAIAAPPILLSDVIRHLQKQFDLSVHAWDFEESISGIQIANGARSCAIGYNDNQHEHRQRLTIAHEIGHFLLGHTRETKPEHFKPTEIQEQEAYEFAGELLMPLQMLKAKITRKPVTIESLAAAFNVSKDAITVRLIKARLIGKL